ncbi:MAG: hypothetical protein LPK11_05675 [Chromatiaceae bacterium]|nr:hypothetical protein [Chromatiaceae bacterium]
MFYIRLAVVSLAILLSACSSHPKIKDFKPSVSNDMAVVYHYRKSQFVGGGRNFHVTNNGKLVFIMENGSFYKELVKPGQATYHSKSLQKHIIGNIGVSLIMNNFEDFEERLTLNAELAKIYYVEWSHGKAEIKSEQIALTEINGLSNLNSQL